MTPAEKARAAHAIDGAKRVLQDYAHYLSPRAKNEIAEVIARAQMGLDEAEGKR